MIVESIHLAGFRGFRAPVQVPFAPGFNVIQGANGAGKSTLCDALEFCLTGRITKYAVEKGANENVSDYIWWRGSDAAPEHFVRVTFRLDNGESITVDRNQEGCSHSLDEITNLFCLEDAPQDALSVLLDTTIIRDESIAALSLDLSDSERYQRVQRALGAVSTEKLLSRAGAVSRVVDEHARSSASQLEDLRQQMGQLLGQRSEAQGQLAHASNAPAAVAALVRLLGDASADESTLIQSARAYYGQQQTWLRDATSAADRVRRLSAELAEFSGPGVAERIASVEARVAELNQQAKDADDAFLVAEAAVKAEMEADAIAAAYARLLEIGERVGLQDHHCPLCAADRTAHEFEAAIAAARQRLAGRGQGAAEAQAAAEEVRKRRAALSELLNVAELELASLRSRADASARLQHDIEQASADVDLPVAVLLSEDAFREAINVAREKMLDVEGHARALLSSAAFGRLSDLDHAVQSLQVELDKAEVVAAQHRKATAVAKAIDTSIKRTAANVVDERLSTISPLLSELYLRLKPHGDWKNIEYRVRGDVRKFLSLSVGSQLNPQFVFSSGQRRITGLAFLLSVHLSRRWCAWDSLVLDDPVQHIDDFRALNLVEVLGSIRKSGRQVICAVEDAALADLLCRRLRATGPNEGQRIVVEQGPAGVSRITAREYVGPPPARVLDVLPTEQSA